MSTIHYKYKESKERHGEGGGVGEKQRKFYIDSVKALNNYHYTINYTI